MQPPGLRSRIWSRVLCATIVLSAVGGAICRSDVGGNWCRALDADPKLGLVQLYECPGTSLVLLPWYLWRPVQISVTCRSSWYTVYVGADSADLQMKIARKDTAWCGADALLDSRACGIQISPFKRSLVGIKAVTADCTVTSGAHLSKLMLPALLAGVAVFFAARHLSSSAAFRISCGTVFFTTGSLLILLVILFRAVPHKRTLAATAAAAGSGGLALLRWLSGQWLPSWHQLVTNRFFGAYVLVSALLGAAVTYLYDDRSNHKVNTLVMVMLRIFGLLGVYFGTWTFFPLGAVAIATMISSVTGRRVMSRVQAVSEGVQQAAQVTLRALATPFTQTKARSRLEGGAPLSSSRLAGRPSAPSAARVPLSDTDVDDLEPREYSHLTPLHLKEGPPDPWTVRPKRRVATFEEKMVRTLAGGLTATPGVSGQSGRRRGRASGSEAGISQPALPTGSSAGNQGAAAPELSDAAGMQQGGAVGATTPGDKGKKTGQGVAAILRKGYIVNSLTGRTIKVGGDVYNQLLEQGFVPDTVQGTMIKLPGSTLPASVDNGL